MFSDDNDAGWSYENEPDEGFDYKITQGGNTMSFLTQLTEAGKIKPKNVFILTGEPGSGKTTLAGTFPKPAIHINVGNDGGSEVLGGYGAAIMSNQTGTQTYGDLIKALKEIREAKPDVKTIIVDPISSVQEQLEIQMKKMKGKNLNFEEWSDIRDKMYNLFDILEELADPTGCNYNVVIVSHIRPRDVVDGTTGETYSKMLPQMSEGTAKRLLKNAPNVWYVTPVTDTDNQGNKIIVRRTIIGGHPMLATKTRTASGSSDNMYFDNFSYDEFIKVKKEIEDTVEEPKKEAKKEVKKAEPKKEETKKSKANTTDDVDDMFSK